jgi:Type IV secretion-system coupling protein DNA-binding domain
MTSSSTQDLTILGKTDHHGHSHPFGITQADRLGHLWILGKTGTGKSTLLTRLIAADLHANRGLMLIDPHGDLVETMLDLVPPSRVVDTIYINPADTAYPFALKPIDTTAGLSPSLMASALLSVLKKAWPDFWGPRLEYVLRSSLLSLFSLKGATLLDLHRLLVDIEFRQRLVSRLRDPQLLQFWHQEFAAYTKTFRTEAVAPIVNKIGQYLTTPLVRHIIGQRTSAVSFRTVMDDGRIVLANLAKGRIGEDVSMVLGSLLVNQLELAALSRADVPISERRHFFLYVDEAHLIATQAMVELFPEARKFHLGITLAHQYPDQLTEDLRHAILGNVGTLIVFRVGARDAGMLAQEFALEMSPTDLVSLPNRQAYLKLLVDGTTTRPFSATMLPPPVSHGSPREEIIAASRRRYCRPVVEVEQELWRPWQGPPSGHQQRLDL